MFAFWLYLLGNCVIFSRMLGFWLYLVGNLRHHYKIALSLRALCVHLIRTIRENTKVTPAPSVNRALEQRRSCTLRTISPQLRSPTAIDPSSLTYCGCAASLLWPRAFPLFLYPQPEQLDENVCHGPRLRLESPRHPAPLGHAQVHLEPFSCPPGQERPLRQERLGGECCQCLAEERHCHCSLLVRHPEVK